MWFPVTIWKLFFLDLKHWHDSLWLQVLSWQVWTSPSNHLWQPFITLGFRSVSDEHRCAFRNNGTWLETRHKTPLDWRAAEIMWGTDEKPRSQMAQRKKWRHVTKRSCSFHLSTVKYSNGVMSKSLHPSHYLEAIKPVQILAAGAPCWKIRTIQALAWRQEINVMWMRRTQQGHASLAFSGIFFSPERPHQAPVFLKYQADHTHTNANIQMSRPADVEIENKSKQLRVRKTTSVSAHSPEFCTLRFSFVTLTDIFMTLFFLASTSDRCRWFFSYLLKNPIKPHHLLKLLLF